MPRFGRLNAASLLPRPDAAGLNAAALHVGDVGGAEVDAVAVEVSTGALVEHLPPGWDQSGPLESQLIEQPARAEGPATGRIDA